MSTHIVWVNELYVTKICELRMIVGPQILPFLSSAQQSTLLLVKIISTDIINFDNSCLSVPTIVIVDLKFFLIVELCKIFMLLL